MIIYDTIFYLISILQIEARLLLTDFKHIIFYQSVVVKKVIYFSTKFKFFIFYHIGFRNYLINIILLLQSFRLPNT